MSYGLRPRELSANSGKDHEEKVEKDTEERVSAEYKARIFKGEADERRRKQEKEDRTPPRESPTNEEDRRYTYWVDGNSHRWTDGDRYGEPSRGW